MSFHDWVEKSVGLKCTSTFMPTYCDIGFLSEDGREGTIGMTMANMDIPPTCLKILWPKDLKKMGYMEDFEGAF